MGKKINEYLNNFINLISLTKVTELSSENKEVYKLNPEYGDGYFKILKFKSNALLILMADFRPKNTLEKITEVSEEYLEISQFETGNSLFKIGGRKVNNIDRGIYFYLNTKKKTYTYCKANKNVKFTKIILTREYFDTFLRLQYGIIDYKDTKIVYDYLLKMQNSLELNFIFQQIRESHVDGKLLPLYLESKIMELLSYVITSITTEEKNISVILSKKDKSNLKKSVNAMKKDLSKHLTGVELANIALMSPSRYQLAFRKYYGVAPYEYLKELRLNKALFLLKNSEENISSIAKKVGYTHAGHFSKIFKSTYGISPSQYRKMIL